ncbi:hypothetical protein PPERSA_09091 [Pseudocohnilembus persalinus]|uniref:Transmembrane protein n=1 Tax=Pseudocohnilembus persalinus TaxID=266149 RepID=A0A0V0Q7Y4_PSEPJ|nr:hypothetical protein PPERSA_09091 [Pseudocohnilembus persalinus]|eukprot:KRW98151.1 hypothetical protein PPERSA_09091 [Pseudocohnilembus persalinus]
MKLNISLFSVLLFVYLLNQGICSYTYKINDVSTWEPINISDKSNYGINYMLKDQGEANQLSLQLTESKIVFVTYGYDSYPDDEDTVNMQIAIFDNKGKILKSVTFDGIILIEHIALSLTNVMGEFIIIYNDKDHTYYTFYDQNLDVTRNIQNEKLISVSNNYYSNISFGKNLMYVALFRYELIKFNQVIVLDLSDITTCSTLQTHNYFSHAPEFVRAYTIQAYNDDSAIFHFYARNHKGENKLFQVQYDSKGQQKSEYPIEQKAPISLTQSFYYPWRSFLLENKNITTFLANDNSNTLLVYTFGKDGNKICSELIDITGYNSQSYLYGILGDQGWIYIDNQQQNEGHFLIFNPKKCQMDFKNIGEGTGLKEGMAGSFMDYDNEEILMLEFGNSIDSSNKLRFLSDSSQKSLQANLYVIGSVKYEKGDDQSDDANNLRFNLWIAVILGFYMI